MLLFVCCVCDSMRGIFVCPVGYVEVRRHNFMESVLLSLLRFQGFTSGHQAFLASALPAEPSHIPQLALILSPSDYLVKSLTVTTGKNFIGT